ncbi:MAG: dissimilatory sulfite reductase D family protein [Anaerolineae bacterium]
MADEELKAKIVEYVKNSKKKVSARDIADGLGLEHRVVKKALSEMVNAGVLEFESFGGATFIKLGSGES